MLEALSSAEINRQQAELLPARTVLSLLTTKPSGGGAGGRGEGGVGINLLNIDVLGHQVNSAGNGIGGAGG